MKGNMKKWAADQIAVKNKKAIPILSFPSISLMGIGVAELIRSSENQARGMKLIAERVDSGASLSMMDLSVEAEAFGSDIIFTEGEVPTVSGSIVNSLEDAEALGIPEVGRGRTGIYVEAIQRAATLISDRPVFAGVIGPFSLAGRLMDVSEALMNCIAEPEMVHRTMCKTTDFLISYIRAYKDTGAGGVVIAEPLTGLLSPELAENFSEPYLREIVDALQDDGFIVIYHNCGNNTILMIDSILRTGAAGFHFGNAIKMADMMPHIPADRFAMGNVDPASQFRNGTPESIYENTLRIMGECCEKFPNFIISSGCDIPPLSGWDNIDAFFRAVKSYYNGSR
ncbi:MAG: uroporphyrinogen decarboxylase family protein [Treponema sp.]|jgi:uroporphyrinogen decarboxylase|nr:uroporphyrinogen decarboxylase family protein [Treponema sp.]